MMYISKIINTKNIIIAINADKYPNKVFESEDFNVLQENALVSLIECDDLQMEKIKFWNYIIKWGIAQNPYEFKLLLHGSRDGFTRDLFWDLCKKKSSRMYHTIALASTFNSHHHMFTKKNLSKNNTMDMISSSPVSCLTTLI
ncbi:serine-enriched protein [Gigaspora margarita]|uniref:Serine-enriched protein n=1 Tax=Gigaspora margarita TaxID=4874 RepID=A0A8H3X4U6_GIGMA|nr:serine-enriched protein [Gigaspora margarita]